MKRIPLFSWLRGGLGSCHQSVQESIHFNAVSRCRFISNNPRIEKPARSNNDMLNSLALAMKFQIKYKMEENSRDKKARLAKNQDLQNARQLLLSVPRSIAEAESIVNYFLSNHKFVLFTESLDPFSYHCKYFLNALNIEFEEVKIDYFGNKQLILNYICELCDNNPSAMCVPIAFINNFDNEMNKKVGCYLIGANEIAAAWQNGTFETYLSKEKEIIRADINDARYKTGEFDVEQWKLVTKILQHMGHGHGYRPTHSYEMQNKPQPTKEQIDRWSNYVGLPLLVKDVGNPQRPTD